MADVEQVFDLEGIEPAFALQSESVDGMHQLRCHLTRHFAVFRQAFRLFQCRKQILFVAFARGLCFGQRQITVEYT